MSTGHFGISFKKNNERFHVYKAVITRILLPV